MDGFGQLLHFEKLRKWSDSARESAIEARRAAREEKANVGTEKGGFSEKLGRMKIGVDIDKVVEPEAPKVVEGSANWKEGTKVGQDEVHHDAKHSSGATAKIREMSNPFRPKLKGAFAHVRVDHPKTGIHEKWIDTGSRESVMSQAREFAESKMRGS